MSLTVSRIYESFDQHPDFQAARITEGGTTRFVLVDTSNLPIEVAFNGFARPDNYATPQGYSVTSLPPSPGDLSVQRVIYLAPGSGRTMWAGQSLQAKSQGRVRASTFDTYRLSARQEENDLRKILLGAHLVLHQQGMELQAFRHTASTTVARLKELGARAANNVVTTIDRAYLNEVSSRQ